MLIVNLLHCLDELLNLDDINDDDGDNTDCGARDDQSGGNKDHDDVFFADLF